MSHTGSYEMTDVPTSNGRTEKIGVDIPSKGYDNYGLSGSSEEEISKVDLGSDECPGFDVTKNMGSEDDDDNEKNCCSRGVASIQNSLSRFYTDYNDTIWLVIYIVVALLYFAYFAYCMWYSFGDEGSVRLLVVTVLATLFIVVRIFMPFFESRGISPLDSLKKKYNSASASRKKQIAKYMTWLYWCFMVGYAIFAIVYVIVDVGLDTPENLISAGGVAFFVISFYIFSVNPAAVRWRPVLWGLYIQFAFALIILRWEFGYQAFNWLGMRAQEFLQHSDEGAKFVFGDLYINHFFAFKVLPVIVFFSTMMSVLYYLGVMQFVIRHIARALAFALGTSPAESLNAAGNIFIGQSEAPLMIRPFIHKLTKSELHAVMTGGFATIAGSVMAAYISYGVPANHLIAASVMSAPAALAMAKLFYPETEETLATAESVYDMENSEHSNVIAAASEGASTSISLISNIAANLIAFISILAFVNATLKWCGHRAGLHDPELTFELICSYVFWPMAYIMGVHADDCRKVGELIGVKTFLNEFVAYTRLSVFIKNKDELHKYIVKRTTLPGWENATVEYIKGDIFLSHINKTLIGGTLSDRSEVISTYALCGFSNIGSLGIMIGALGALAPSRKTDITQTVVRAMIAGNVACFLTASIAGLLYRDPIAGIMSNSTS